MTVGVFVYDDLYSAAVLVVVHSCVHQGGTGLPPVFVTSLVYIDATDMHLLMEKN